jgi:hypothetical protein
MSESIKSQESDNTKSQDSDSVIESGSSSFRDESEKIQSKVEIENGDTTKDPRSWPNARKLRATACIGALSFLEPFASSIIAPSLEIMAGEFNITSPVERNVSDDALQIAFTRRTADNGLTDSFFSPPLYCLTPSVH